MGERRLISSGSPYEPVVGFFDGFARAHGEAFRDVRPANTTVAAALLDPRWLVELEVEAVLPGHGRLDARPGG